MIRGMIAALLGVTGWHVLAVAEAPAPGESSIAGKVVNSVTGEPIRRAAVNIRSEKDFSRTVLTDGGGTYRFTGLPKGSYMLKAQRPGFEAFRGLTLAPSREDASIRLTPQAVIKGKLVDSGGEPIQGLVVQALRTRIESGFRKLGVVSSAITDDRGEYRMAGLTPGSYYVRTAGRSGGTRMYVGNQAPAFESHEGFAAVYYPRAVTLAAANAVKAAPGRELAADFTLAAEPAFKIRGVITNFVPYSPVHIELMRGEEELLANRASLNSATGRFEIHDVVSGVYLLRATAGEGEAQSRGERAFTVGGTDVNAAILELAPAVTVSGTVRSPRDAAAGKTRPRIFCDVSLEPKSRFADYSKSHHGVVDADGQFEIRNVPPGRYRIRVMPHGATYVSSAMLGTRDLLADGELTVFPGAAPAPIEIVLRAGGGSVEGVVTPGNAARVALVPESGVNIVPTMETMSRSGAFRFDYVPPGDYLACAWNAGEEIEYANPQVVRSLPNVERVRVSEGVTAKVEIKLPAVEVQ